MDSTFKHITPESEAEITFKDDGRMVEIVQGTDVQVYSGEEAIAIAELILRGARGKAALLASDQDLQELVNLV